MTWINTLTNSANQSMILKLGTGALVNFSIKYFPNQQGWYYSFNYGSFTINNRRLVVGANLLRAFRNLLPFGFACLTKDGYEPVYQNDFANGRAQFYLLNAADVQSVEATVIA